MGLPPSFVLFYSAVEPDSQPDKIMAAISQNGPQHGFPFPDRKQAIRRGEK